MIFIFLGIFIPLTLWNVYWFGKYVEETPQITYYNGL
tara:strand:- start:601 stop:711 length:111 start_codon:yes stop_codon:yes gene_type:complete